MPRGVLVDPKAEVEQEYYAGVVWDGTAKKPLMLFSDMGGIDIEQVAEEHPDHVGRGHFSTLQPFSDFQAKQVIAAAGVTGKALQRATPVLARLAQLFLDNDMTLAEINPLAELQDGSFVALDAHMEMENEGMPRQQGLLKALGIGEEEGTREGHTPTSFEEAVKAIDAADHRGVIQGKDTGFNGNIGLVIGAGGGSLTLTDAVRQQGGQPANYSEIGGNPSVAKACGLAKQVLQKDGVEKIAVMMSIVSNTRVDIVARGVIKACLELGKDPGETIAIFRIPGAWEEEGFKILDKYGIEYCDRSVSLWEAAGRAVARSKAAHGGVAMSILIDQDTTFIIQGITGREAVNLTRECLDYGSKIVGGVTPGRKGREVHGVPVFDTVEQVVEHNGGVVPDGSVVTVPPAGTRDAVFEALHAGIKTIVIVTERIPRRDVAMMVELADAKGARIIGPNCLGRDRPGRGQDGRHRRPGAQRRRGLPARRGRRDEPLRRHDHGDLLHADGRRAGRLHGRLDRRRRDHRLDLRRADAVLRGRRADPGDRDLHRARRPHGGPAGAVGHRATTRACRSSRSWPASSWTTRRCRACPSGTPARSSRARRTPRPRRSPAWRRPASRSCSGSTRSPTWSRPRSRRRSRSMRKDGTFIAVEVDDAGAADTELARKLTEACPVDIFAQRGRRRLRSSSGTSTSACSAGCAWTPSPARTP